MHWRDALQSLKSPEQESMKLLKAHMLEHGWGTPIKYNFACQLALPTARPTKQARKGQELPAGTEPEAAFSPHQPAQNRPPARSAPAPLRSRELSPPRLSDRPPAASETSSVCASCKNSDR
jgi:hypothetical protein